MTGAKTYDIPKLCKAGVVINEGPDFKLAVEDVPVPEPGKCLYTQVGNQQLKHNNRSK